MQYKLKTIALVFCAITLLWNGAAFARQTVAEKKPLIISKTGQNFNPALAYNSLTDKFFVAWIQATNIMNSSDLKIRAVEITSVHRPKIRNTLNISRPSPNKSVAPYVTVIYSPAEETYFVFWQEIENDQKTLILSTVNSTFQFSRRASTFTTDQGILVSPPILLENGNEDNLTILWNEYRENIFRTSVSTFRPSRPTSQANTIFTLSESSKYLEIPYSMLNEGAQQFALYGFFINLNINFVRNVYTHTLDGQTGIIGERSTIAKKNIEDSLLLGATRGITDNHLLINFIDSQGLSSLAIVKHQPDITTLPEPLPINLKETEAYEGVILAEAFDDELRILWIEESDGTYSLKISSYINQFVDEATIIYKSNQPIMNLRAIYNSDKSKIFIVWSENHQDGGVRLKAQTINL